MQSTLTSKGQTTIPKEIRELLGIAPGDQVKWFVHSDGRVALLPVVPVSSLRGIVRSRKDPVSLEEMAHAAKEGAMFRYKRYTRQK